MTAVPKAHIQTDKCPSAQHSVQAQPAQSYADEDIPFGGQGTSEASRPRKSYLRLPSASRYVLDANVQAERDGSK